MSYERVKEFFDQNGMEGRVTLRAHITDTVEHAAQQIGCEPAQIAKTMSFLTKEGPVLIVMAGDAKIQNAKYKAFFGQKASMIHGEEVEALIGHEPGGVCPFAVKEGVRVFLDVSLKRFTEVHAAAGSPQATIRLTIPELERYAGNPQWIDVCKDWEGCPQQ